LQVAPRGEGSRVWPFVVLLAGLLIPNVAAPLMACWAWVGHRYPQSGTPMKLLLTALWVLPFTLWLAGYLICRCVGWCLASAPSKDACAQAESASLDHLIDPVKYAALVSALIAVTADPIFAAVASVCFMQNNRALGQQVLTTPAYCVSMAFTSAHLATALWEHSAAMIMHTTWCDCFKACAGYSLKPPAEGDGYGSLSIQKPVSAGEKPEVQVFTA
jgi:hypothetical protein